MLSDRQLRDYVEDAMLPAQRTEFERRLVTDNASRQQVIAQELIGRALRTKYAAPSALEQCRQRILDVVFETRPDVLKSIASGSKFAPPPPRPATFRSRKKIAVMAAIAVAAFSLIFATVGQPARIARIDAMAPGAEVIRGEKATAVWPGAWIVDGDLVKVPERLTLEYRDATILDLGTASQLRFRKGKHVEAFAGNADVIVRRQTSDKSMIISTARAKLTTHGAVFKISADAMQTRIEVSWGSVHVERIPDGPAVDVNAGEFTVASDDRELRAESS